MNKLKKKGIIYIFLFIFILTLCLLTGKVSAASISVSASSSKGNVGDNITITVTGNDVAGKVSLVVSGNATLKDNSVWVDNSSASTTVNLTAAGTVTVTATASDMAINSSLNGDVYSGNASCSIEVISNENSNTGSTGETNNNQNDNNNQGTTTETPKENIKSNNANLRDLGITPNDFKGFKYGTTSYDVTVPNNIKHVEVYAFAQHEKATVTGTGFRTLQEGENALSVVVTAEDGTTKTYIVNVTREAAEEEKEDDDEDTKEDEEEKEPEEKEEPEEIVDENKENSKGLLELKIKNVTLKPEFKTNVYEYEVKYIGEATELEITTKVTDEGYVVDVTGNEDLKDGENIITILVSDKDGNNVATYQINVNKSLVDEDAILREQEEQRKQGEKNKKIVVGAVIAIAVVAVIVFFIIRNRRDRGYADNYSEVSFSNLNDEDEWQDNSNWQVESSESEKEEESFDEPRRTRHKAKRFK